MSEASQEVSRAAPREPPLLYMILVVGTLGSLMYFGMVYGIAKLSYAVGRVFGLSCSVVFAFCGLFFVAGGYQFVRETRAADSERKGLRLIPAIENIFHVQLRFNPEEVRRMALSLFLPVLCLFVASWSSLTYGFVALSSDRAEVTFGLIFRHYLWQLVDLVPVIDAWKAIHLEDPFLETRLGTGILLVAFRIVVLAMVFTTGKQLLGLKSDKKSDDSAED